MSARIGSNGPDVACHDCRRRLFPPTPGQDEWYMVADPVWDACGLAPFEGCLCLLVDEPINTPRAADSPRLAALKRAAARRHADRP